MKILAVIGSPKAHGNTFHLVSAVENRINELDQDCEFEYLFLKDACLQPCMGCYVCLDKGEQLCPVKDDRPIIEAKMQEADGVIFASPVYVYNMSGLMKNFVDRFAYTCHRPQFFKPAIVVSTTGAVGLAFTLFLLSFSIGTWGFKTVGKAGGITPKHPEGLPPGAPEKNRTKAEKSAARAAENLYKSIKAWPASPTLFGMIQFQLQKKAFAKSSQGCDYEYWKKKGWLEKETAYYYPARVNPIKLALVRCLSPLLSKLI